MFARIAKQSVQQSELYKRLTYVKLWVIDMSHEVNANVQTIAIAVFEMFKCFFKQNMRLLLKQFKQTCKSNTLNI